jgi:hypothetical protein
MAVADPVDIGPPRSLVPFAPTTGADTDAILLELGVSPSEAAALRADGVVGTLETSRG